jgi:translation elongation factor EF-1beta
MQRNLPNEKESNSVESQKIDIMSFNKDKLNLINNDFNKLGFGLVSLSLRVLFSF